jgi:hypothetical protein
MTIEQHGVLVVRFASGTLAEGFKDDPHHHRIKYSLRTA